MAARAAETDAQDQLEAAREALASCEENLRLRERNLSWSKPSLDKAIDTVIVSEANSRILRETQEAQERLIAKRLELRTILFGGQMDEEQAAEAKQLLYSHVFPGASGCTHFSIWDVHPATLKWQ